MVGQKETIAIGHARNVGAAAQRGGLPTGAIERVVDILVAGVSGYPWVDDDEYLIE